MMFLARCSSAGRSWFCTVRMVLYVLLFSLTTSVAVFSPLWLSKLNVLAENPSCKHSIDRNAFSAATCSSTRSSTLLSWMRSSPASSVASASYTRSPGSK